MKTHKKTKTPAIALLLALILLFWAFPIDVLPAFAEEGAEPEPVELYSEDGGVVDALYEMTELRTVDTKYIKMSDGTVRAAVYGNAVHRKDANGVWQEIDNSLTVCETGVESERAHFALKTGEEAPVSLYDDGVGISFSLLGAQSGVPAEVIRDGRSDGKYDMVYEELTTLEKNLSSLRYSGVLPETDLEYILTGNDLKENIVIHGLCESYTYSFTLALEGLSAFLAEDGSVTLTNGEEELYRIPAPYMYDAAGEYSDAVFYTLEGEDGAYILTVTADEAWIGDEGRAFPVIVDPSVLSMNYIPAVVNTYVKEYDTSCHYNDSTLYVGVHQNHFTDLYYSISSFPSDIGLPLLSATMTVHVLYSWQYFNNYDWSSSDFTICSVNYTPDLTTVNCNTDFGTAHYVYSVPFDCGDYDITFDLLDAEFLTAHYVDGHVTYRISFNNSNAKNVNVDSVAGNTLPVLNFHYGYAIPEEICSANTTQRFNISSVESNSPGGRELIKTVNGQDQLIISPYTQLDARANLVFILNSNNSVRIYADYDMKYFKSSDTPGGAVTAKSNTYTNWIIVRLNNGGYIFLSHLYPSLALTDDNNGVYVKPISNADIQHQIWYIYAEPGYAQMPVETGIYYINSNYYKKFLINSNGNLEMCSGTEAELGDSMAWRISYAGNGKYSVQSVSNPHLFWTSYGLYMTQVNLSNEYPDYVTVEIEQEGSCYKFKKTIGDIDYYVNAWTYDVEWDEYDYTSLWRLCKRSDYDELQNFQISTQQIPVGNTLTINEITSNLSSIYTYSTPNNFAFESIESTLGLSVSSQSVLAYEVITGNCEIRVRHLPTNQYCVIKIIISISDFVNSNSNINSMINRDSIYQYICDYNFSSYNNPQTGEDDTLKEDFNSSSYNNNYIYFDGHDCANFGSQCLFAGGLQFGNAPVSQNDANSLYNNEDSWYYIPLYGLSGDYAGVSETWRIANKLKKYWTKRTNNNLDRCYRYVEYNTAQQFYYTIDYWYNELKPGDMIFMYGPGETNAHHTIIVTATAENDILVSYHSTNRFCASLKQLVYNNSTERYCVVQIAA